MCFIYVNSFPKDYFVFIFIFSILIIEGFNKKKAFAMQSDYLELNVSTGRKSSK